jgi:hypothetical protein
MPAADGPRAMRRPGATACDTIHAASSVAVVRPESLVGDDQITWATAMRTATNVACVIADGYSVNRQIAPKQ